MLSLQSMTASPGANEGVAEAVVPVPLRLRDGGADVVPAVPRPQHPLLRVNPAVLVGEASEQAITTTWFEYGIANGNLDHQRGRRSGRNAPRFGPGPARGSA